MHGACETLPIFSVHTRKCSQPALPAQSVHSEIGPTPLIWPTAFYVSFLAKQLESLWLPGHQCTKSLALTPSQHS